MMKFIFCLLALLIQPIVAWYAFHGQDKRQAALKMPVIFFSGVYLAAQFYVFFKYCIRFPERYQIWAYLIQAAILLAFLAIEFVFFGSNRYIERIDKQEQDSICGFKHLIQELELYRMEVADGENQRCVDSLLERMRYADPVSSPAVKAVEARIHDLIAELPGITEQEAFKRKCDEIAKQLEIRKIKNIKEHG